MQRKVLTEKGSVIEWSNESVRNTCEIMHHACILVKRNGISVKLANRDGSWYKYVAE